MFHWEAMKQFTRINLATDLFGVVVYNRSHRPLIEEKIEVKPAENQREWVQKQSRTTRHKRLVVFIEKTRILFLQKLREFNFVV